MQEKNINIKVKTLVQIRIVTPNIPGLLPKRQNPTWLQFLGGQEPLYIESILLNLAALTFLWQKCDFPHSKLGLLDSSQGRKAWKNLNPPKLLPLQLLQVSIFIIDHYCQCFRALKTRPTDQLMINVKHFTLLLGIFMLISGLETNWCSTIAELGGNQ